MHNWVSKEFSVARNGRNTCCLRYSDGSVYKGEVDENIVPHGLGIHKTKDGDFYYYGDWHHGRVKGHGTFYHQESQLASEGRWVDENTGKVVDVCCSPETFWSRYEGEIKDGHFDGYGHLIQRDGMIYRGNFKNGKTEGHGVLTFPNGDVHEGNHKEGKFHGYGEFRYKNGDVYQGEFQNDMATGKGKKIFVDNSVFEGTFENYDRTGKGTLHLVEGGVLTANYDRDERLGDAECVWENGDMWKGVFVSHDVAIGTKRFANGDKLTGQWKGPDLRNGIGEMTLKPHKHGWTTNVSWLLKKRRHNKRKNSNHENDSGVNVSVNVHDSLSNGHNSINKGSKGSGSGIKRKEVKGLLINNVFKPIGIDILPSPSPPPSSSAFLSKENKRQQ
eukprot:TRINITY_DN3625_c0_g7_i1.p1 TRINITY_DN3625_c0_g7~~TRINITY_DN3625_c0_g7_i1.p1  ORF type:complete len:388 (+),score=68.05 TRINITY_DN3625_c0_g7_i1:301-1464(+)